MDVEEKTVEEQEQEEKEFETGILDAIDQGIVDSGSPAVKPEDVESESESDDEPKGKSDDSDGESKSESESDPENNEEESKEEKTDQTAGEPGSEDDADSLPAKKDASEDSSSADQSEKSDAKPSDEFGDLPEGTKKETAERFDVLKGKYDEQAEQFETQKTELERVTQQNTDWMETIQSTGANPEQFGRALSYLEDINKGTPESLERAYETMSGELKVLAQALGKEAPGVDPLAGHDDLVKKVEDGFLDRADALEIAGARAQSNIHKQSQNIADRQTTDQQAYDSGLESIRLLGQELNTKDPVAFKAKYPYLKSVIKAVVSSGAPPDSWEVSIREAFNDIEAPVIQETRKPKQAANPMRPSGNAGSSESAKEPGSAMEAINQALGMSN